MNYVRIDGTITATACHPSMRGFRTVICQPIDATGAPAGDPILAIDPHGAALHQRAILSTDGSTTRQVVRDPRSPLRNLIIGIADAEKLERRN
ncbi:MAG: ethanolamine utilization protein EutN [Opitutaceae bacterium]|jgi:microcompartment protein CcmK/EutM|nr:ethanolamine utilization protein EutN [Opitutaceae bacterium]